jgi:hypothetical protein
VRSKVARTWRFRREFDAGAIISACRFNRLKFRKYGHESADMQRRKELRMSTINPVISVPYTPSVTTLPNQSSSTSDTESPAVQDAVELSLAGRIALGVADGRLTSTQGQQLGSQFEDLNQTIQTGGASVAQLQSQLSQAIYGDGHNGATIPTNPTVTTAEERTFVQAGRVATQENDGHLTSSQASQFYSQISQIYRQSQNGVSASATNQAQNQLSAQIFDTAHNFNAETSS